MPNDVINTVTIHGTTYGIGGSGGHTIKNPAGTAMTQRSNLQFVDLTISDDSTNDVTKVESVHMIQSESELDNLPDGLYMLNEDEGTVLDASAVGYDNTDSGLEATNVQDAIDEVVEALDDKIDISAKGTANGVAELDENGKVPSSQLPSYVDDVLEYSSISAFPATGESGKIYVALDTNKTYRWSGTEYVEISESLALGETSSTAYRGDRGKTAYDHSQLTSGNPHNVTKSDIGLDNVDNTSDSTKKTNFTGSIASDDTGFTTGGDVYTALGGKADKVSGATNGNLAGLNGSGNLTDSGWNGAKDTTSISGNPISISGLKSNQLTVNPIITLEPIQAGSGTPSPSNIRAISGYDKIEVLSHKPLFASYQHNTAIGNDGKSYTNTDCMLVNPKFNCKSGEKFYISITASSNLSIILQGYNSSGGYLGYYRINNNSYFVPSTLLSGCTSFYIQLNGSGTNEPTSYTFETTDISESLGQTVYWLTHTVRTGIAKILGQLLVNPQNLDWHEGSRNVFYAALTSGVGNGWSSHYAFSNLPYQTMDDLTWYTQNNYIYVRNTNYGGNVSGFAASLNDVQFVYPLATPTEIQLTPHEISLLKDYAYVSTNGTTIALDYHNGEMASLSDVAQVGETVNNVLNNPSILDVTSKFVANSDNVYSTTLKAFKMGRIVFITGSFHPKALSTFQNKSWFAITDDSLLPINSIDAVATFTPVETAVSSTVAFPIYLNNTLKEIRTANNGAYGGVTNITTSSLVVCTMMYICKG